MGCRAVISVHATGKGSLIANIVRDVPRYHEEFVQNLGRSPIQSSLVKGLRVLRVLVHSAAGSRLSHFQP